MTTLKSFSCSSPFTVCLSHVPHSPINPRCVDASHWTVPSVLVQKIKKPRDVHSSWCETVNSKETKENVRKDHSSNSIFSSCACTGFYEYEDFSSHKKARFTFTNLSPFHWHWLVERRTITSIPFRWISSWRSHSRLFLDSGVWRCTQKRYFHYIILSLSKSSFERSFSIKSTSERTPGESVIKTPIASSVFIPKFIWKSYFSFVFHPRCG